MRTLASVGLALVLAGWSVPALGQSLTEMIAKDYANAYIEKDQQIVNAVKAAEEAVKTYVTSGESTRGATGPISSLLVESDTIICASWLIAYERAMTTLATSGAFNTPAGAALVQALWNLKNRIEAACQEILNDTPDGPGVHGPGETPGGEGGGQLQPNTCPDCPYEKNARDLAQYRLDAARHRADIARSRTKWLTQMWLSNPKLATLLAEETVAEAERTEERRYEELERAQSALDAAQRALVRCLESCHKQVGFFDRKKVLYTAAAVAVASVAMIGGGGTQTTFVSTPPAAPPVATTPAAPPVATTPAPTPASLVSLVVGRWVCAACRVTNDPDRHENTLRFCAQLIAIFQLLANSPLRIEHPQPWITPSGDLDEITGGYRGTGNGPLGSFPNVSSTVTAAFQRTGDIVNAVDLTVTLGENGAFPGGRPVTYSVRLTKTP
jgi:hypothetical protein